MLRVKGYLCFAAGHALSRPNMWSAGPGQMVSSDSSTTAPRMHRSQCPLISICVWRRSVSKHPWGNRQGRSPGRPSKRPFWNVTTPIADALKAGTMTRREAAEVLGVCVDTCRRWMPVANARGRQRGGRPSKKPRDAVLLECLRRLYSRELSRKQMARQFGVTTKTTFIWTRELNRSIRSALGSPGSIERLSRLRAGE